MQPTEYDRRGWVRFASNQKILIRLADRDLPLEGTLLNLDPGGLCFTFPVDLSKDRRYEAELRLSDKKEILATIRPQWTQQMNGEFLCGAHFHSTDGMVQEELIEFAERSLSTSDTLKKDRRGSNRRQTTPSPQLQAISQRGLERRAGVRWQERQGVAARFLSPALRKYLHRRVVVTGVGVVSPIGSGVEAFKQSLIAGKSGVRPITLFDASLFPCQIGGEVVEFNPSHYISAKRANRMDRATQMGVVASMMAVRDSGIHFDTENRRRIGVSMGTTVGGIGWAFSQDDAYEKGGTSAMHPYTIAAASPNACSGEIAAEIRAQGPSTSFSQGCASSAAALLYGFERIRDGHADVMLCGGCEAPFIPSLFAAFCRSGIMAKVEGADSTLGYPRPFSKSRLGVVLAEGAATLILEDEEHALTRGATIYAELITGASTCDGFDMVHPRSDGAEAARAMRSAISQAEIDPGNIDAIFTHAAGSKLADAMEIKGIREVFGPHFGEVAIANLKSLMGYAQGASTVLESASACVSLRDGFIPPVLNVDPSEVPLNMAPTFRPAELNKVLVNCFGFGGKNVCLIFGKRVGYGNAKVS